MKRLATVLSFVLVFLFTGSALAAVSFFDGIWDVWSELDNSESEKYTRLLPDGSSVGESDDPTYLVTYSQWQDSALVTLYDDSEHETAIIPLILTTKDRNLQLPGGLRIGDPISKALNNISGEANRDGDMYAWENEDYIIILVTRNDAIEVLTYMKKDMGNVKINHDYSMYLNRNIARQPRPATPAVRGQVQRAERAPVEKNSKKTAENLFGEKGAASLYESAPVQSNDSENTANLSTDAKVINFYPLTPGEKNMLGIQHRAAYRLYTRGSYKKAYEAFSKLADEYSCNYLSAYWAAESAMKLRKRDDAKSWYDKAISINPDYKPASDARAKMK